MMKLRDKILYMSFGAGLVVLGMVLNILVTDANADKGSIDAKFGKVTCQELEVLGKSRFMEKSAFMHIKAFRIDTIVLRGQNVVVINSIGKPRGYFGMKKEDAILEILGDDSETRVAYLGVNTAEDGEMMLSLRSKSKTDKRQVSMGINEYGGRFDGFNKMGEGVVRIGVGSDGSGVLDLRDKHGYTK